MAPADVDEVVGAGPFDDVGALVEDLEDPLGARLGALAHHHELAEHHEGRLEHQQVGVEGRGSRRCRGGRR